MIYSKTISSLTYWHANIDTNESKCALMQSLNTFDKFSLNYFCLILCVFFSVFRDLNLFLEDISYIVYSYSKIRVKRKVMYVCM